MVNEIVYINTTHCTNEQTNPRDLDSNCEWEREEAVMKSGKACCSSGGV